MDILKVLVKKRSIQILCYFIIIIQSLCLSIVFVALAPTPAHADRSLFPHEGDIDIPVPAQCSAEDITILSSTIGIYTMKETADEGDLVTFRVCRCASNGDLRINMVFGGDATLDSDYILRGVNSIDGSQAMVTIPDGQSFVEVTVETMDDVPSEADEAIILTLNPDAGYIIDEVFGSASVTIPQNDFVVTNTDDAGEGSLRQSILNANAIEGPDTIVFDAILFPHATPQTISLKSELPALTDDLTINGYIEGRLWQATGMTVSGNHMYRVFNIAPGAKVSISHLTIAYGYARDGGGIANRGELVIKGVTFEGNIAARNGGGLANLDGTATMINSTFADNTADNAGGGLADFGIKTTVTNCTFSNNTAKEGGGIFSKGTLLLRNTILANSESGMDCLARGALDPASTNNLIETNDGCGKPISLADPFFQFLGYYNGPTKTFPLKGGSPAINMGDNGSAVDENGEPLKWDQRGSGDPRFVGGITDIGAFERQAFPYLTVDTYEDADLRSCTRAGKEDCSLRGAIILANATSKVDVIRFDPDIFSIPQTIMLKYPLPDLETDMTIDGDGTAGVAVSGNGRFTVFNVVPDTKVRLNNIRIENYRSSEHAHKQWGGCLFPLPIPSTPINEKPMPEVISSLSAHSLKVQTD